jgi:dATP pyrophosphohydrolase
LVVSSRRYDKDVRQPVQALVNVARAQAGEWQYVLLHRVARGDDFWQGVTGGAEDDESPLQAAGRELHEETAFDADRLVDLHFSYTFPLSEKWRDLYSRGVEEIREHAFVARGDVEPVIDPTEHYMWCWYSAKEALALLQWPNNREALRQAEAYLRADAPAVAAATRVARRQDRRQRTQPLPSDQDRLPTSRRAASAHALSSATFSAIDVLERSLNAKRPACTG